MNFLNPYRKHGLLIVPLNSLVEEFGIGYSRHFAEYVPATLVADTMLDLAWAIPDEQMTEFDCLDHLYGDLVDERKCYDELPDALFSSMTGKILVRLDAVFRELAIPAIAGRGAKGCNVSLFREDYIEISYERVGLNNTVWSSTYPDRDRILKR